ESPVDGRASTPPSAVSDASRGASSGASSGASTHLFAPSAASPAARPYTRARFLLQTNGVWLAVAALFLLSGVLSPGTMTFDHFADVLQVASFLGVAALGQTAVILGGGIDLSIGGVITLSNIVAPAVMNGDPGRIVPVTLF